MGCFVGMIWHAFCQKSLKNNEKNRIMDTLNLTKVYFHQIITIIQRDDGKKNKTLEKETRFPSV